MKIKLFTFVKPSEKSKATGHTIARFIHEETKIPMCWDATIADEPLDAILLMSGAAAYCNVRDQLASAIRGSRRVVWVQDDYVCEPTPPDSKAESPYRRAFVERAQRGDPPVDYWTNLERNSSRTNASALVAWNKLGYDPQPVPRNRGDFLIYYGVWRQRRIQFLDLYFKSPGVRSVISSKPGNGFSDRYPKCEHVGIFPRTTLLDGLAHAGLGLYVEDAQKYSGLTPPARRFYEMLSAGLPMVFHPECLDTLGVPEADQYVCNGSDDLLDKFMRDRNEIAQTQAAAWRRDYVSEVREDLQKAWSKLRESLS